MSNSIEVLSNINTTSTQCLLSPTYSSILFNKVAGISPTTAQAIEYVSQFFFSGLRNLLSIIRWVTARVPSGFVRRHAEAGLGPAKVNNPLSSFGWTNTFRTSQPECLAFFGGYGLGLATIRYLLRVGAFVACHCPALDGLRSHHDTYS